MKDRFALGILASLVLLMAAMSCQPGEIPQTETSPTLNPMFEEKVREELTTTTVTPATTAIPPTITASLMASLIGSGGGVIAFQSDRDRQDEIYIMNADGSDPRVLIANPSALDSMPAWSPEGDRIAFASRHRGKDFEIYVVSLNDSLQVIGETPQLTDNDFDDLHPTWSPDGTQIAFFSKRSTNNEIYVIDVDSRGDDQLMDHIAIGKDPAWSPDGTHIAFVSGRDGDQEVFVMKTDGSDQRPLTDNDANDWSPAWSPDGARIAFISDRNSDQHLFVMDADGSNPRQLTDASFPGNDDPTWSPDGTKIAFRANCGGFVDIYSMDSDGSTMPQQLTSNGEFDQDRAPAWRPIKTNP